MELSFVNDFAGPVIFGICLFVWYIIKKFVSDVDNKYIPAVCAILGLFIAVWIAGWKITPEIILQGLFSGLSATGLHQLFKQLIEGKAE